MSSLAVRNNCPTSKDRNWTLRYTPVHYDKTPAETLYRKIVTEQQNFDENSPSTNINSKINNHLVDILNKLHAVGVALTSLNAPATADEQGKSFSTSSQSRHGKNIPTLVAANDRSDNGSSLLVAVDFCDPRAYVPPAHVKIFFEVVKQLPVCSFPIRKLSFELSEGSLELAKMLWDLLFSSDVSNNTNNSNHHGDDDEKKKQKRQQYFTLLREISVDSRSDILGAGPFFLKFLRTFPRIVSFSLYDAKRTRLFQGDVEASFLEACETQAEVNASRNSSLAEEYEKSAVGNIAATKKQNNSPSRGNNNSNSTLDKNADVSGDVQKQQLQQKQNSIATTFCGGVPSSWSRRFANRLPEDRLADEIRKNILEANINDSDDEKKRLSRQEKSIINSFLFCRRGIPLLEIDPSAGVFDNEAAAIRAFEKVASEHRTGKFNDPSFTSEIMMKVKKNSQPQEEEETIFHRCFDPNPPSNILGYDKVNSSNNNNNSNSNDSSKKQYFFSPHHRYSKALIPVEDESLNTPPKYFCPPPPPPLPIDNDINSENNIDDDTDDGNDDQNKFDGVVVAPTLASSRTTATSGAVVLFASPVGLPVALRRGSDDILRGEMHVALPKRLTTMVIDETTASDQRTSEQLRNDLTDQRVSKTMMIPVGTNQKHQQQQQTRSGMNNKSLVLFPTPPLANSSHNSKGIFTSPTKMMLPVSSAPVFSDPHQNLFGPDASIESGKLVADRYLAQAVSAAVSHDASGVFSSIFIRAEPRAGVVLVALQCPVRGKKVYILIDDRVPLLSVSFVRIPSNASPTSTTQRSTLTITKQLCLLRQSRNIVKNLANNSVVIQQLHTQQHPQQQPRQKSLSQANSSQSEPVSPGLLLPSTNALVPVFATSLGRSVDLPSAMKVNCNNNNNTTMRTTNQSSVTDESVTAYYKNMSVTAAAFITSTNIGAVPFALTTSTTDIHHYGLRNNNNFSNNNSKEYQQSQQFSTRGATATTAATFKNENNFANSIFHTNHSARVFFESVRACPWIPLLEKALAKLFGSYDNLSTGTFQTALEILLGGSAAEFAFPDFSAFSATKVSTIEQDLNKKRGVDKFLNYGYPDFNHPHSLQSSNGKKKSDDIVEEGFVYFGQHLFHPNAIRTSVAKHSLILARCEAETPEAARSLAERGLAPEELFLVEKTFDIDDEELQGGKFAVAAKKKLSKRELLLLKRKQQAMHDSVYRYDDDDLLAMDDDESDDDDEADEEDANVIEEKRHLDEEAALKKKLDAEEESIINSHHHVPHQHYRLFRLRSIERQINNFAAAATASVHPSTKPWSAAHTFSSSSDYQQHNLSLGPLTIQSPRPPPPTNASQQQQQHFFFNNNNFGVGLRNTLFSQGTALYNKWAVRLGCVPLAMNTHNNNNNHNMKKSGTSNISDDTQRSQFSNNNVATNNNNNNFVVTVNGALPPSAVTVSQPLTRGPGSFRAGVLSPQVATTTATVNAFVPLKQMATRKQPVAVIASIEQIETNEEEDDSDDDGDDDEDEDDESYSSEATTSIANSQTSISLKNNSASINNFVKHNSNASYLNSTNPPTPNNKLHQSDIMRKLSIASGSEVDNVSSQHLVPVPPPPSFSFVPMMTTNNAAADQPSSAVRPLPQPKKLNVSYSSSTENNRSTTFFSESLPSGNHSPARDKQQQQQQHEKKVSPDNSSGNNNSQASQLRKSPDNNSNNNQKFVNNKNNNNNSATSAIVTSPDCFLVTAEDFFVTFRAAIVLSFLHQSPTIDVHRETIPIKISLSRKKLASLLQTMMMTMNANNNNNTYQEETLLLHQQSLRSSSIPSSLLSLRRESYRSWLEFAPAFIVRNVAGKHSIRIVAGIADHVKFFSQHRQQQQQQNRKNKNSMIGLQISVLELRQDAVNSTENAVSNFLSSRHTQQTLREIIVPRQFCWDAQKDLLFETPVVFSGSVSLDMKLTPRAATSNTCLYVVISACSVDQNDSSDDEEEVENKNNKINDGNPSQVEEADLFVQCWLDGGSAEEVFIQRVNDRIHVVTSLPDTIDATLAPCVEVDDFISKTARNLSQQQVPVNNNNNNNNVYAPLRQAGSGRNCFVEEISPSVPSGTPTASARPPVSPANSNNNNSNNNSKLYLDDQQNHQQVERRSRGSSLHSADGSGTVEAGNNNNNNNTNNSHSSSAKEFSPATSVFGEDDQNKFHHHHHHHRPQSRQTNENGDQDQPQIKRISFSQTTPIELASTAISRPTKSKNTNCNADDEGDSNKTFRQKKAELFQSLMLPSSSASSLLTTQHKLFPKRSQNWTLADFPQFLVRFSHLPIPPKVVVPLPRSRRASSNVSRRGSHVPNTMMMMTMTNSPSGGSILGSPPYASSMQGGSPNATSGIVPARSPTSRIFGASSLFAFATQGNNNYHNDALQSDGEHVLSHQTANSVHNDVGVTILVEAPHLRGVSLFNRTKMGFAVFQLEDETTSPTQQKRQENITRRFQNFDELALVCSSTRWSTAAATNSNITNSGTTSVGENCVFTTTKEGSGVPCIFHAHTVGPSIAIRLPVAPPPVVLHQQNFAQSTANASNLPPQHNPFLQQQNSNNNYNNYQNNVSRKTSLLPGAGDSLSEPPSSCSNQGSRRPSSLVTQKQPSNGNYNNSSNNVETENNNNNNINGATVTPPNVVLPLKSVVVTPSMMTTTPPPPPAAANVVHQIHPTSNQFVSRTFLIIPSFLGETMDGYSDEVFLMNNKNYNPDQRSKKDSDTMNCFKEIFTTVYARNAVNVSVIPLSK